MLTKFTTPSDGKVDLNNEKNKSNPKVSSRKSSRKLSTIDSSANSIAQVISPSDSLKVATMTSFLVRKAQQAEAAGKMIEAVDHWQAYLRQLLCATRSQVQGAAPEVEENVLELASVHYRLGILYRALRDTAGSIQHFKMSIRLNANEPKYFHAYGKAFLQTGHWRIAKTQFEKAIQLDPRNPIYLRHYAWVLMMMGRKTEARMASRRALEMAPGSFRTQWNMARIFMESEMYLSALKLLKKMEQRWPKSERLQQLTCECHLKLETTLEGMVLKVLRRGLKCDGAPFTLADFKRCQSLWQSFCTMLGDASALQPTSPHVWAAAVTFMASQYRKWEPFTSLSSLICDRFSTCEIDMWPCLLRLQRAIPSDLQIDGPSVAIH